MKLGIAIGSIIGLSAVAALIYVWHSKDSEFEKETAAFATEAINAISAAWEPEAFAARAEPGLVTAMTAQGHNPADLLKIYSRLGGLKAEPECRLKNTYEINTNAGSYTTATYHCDALYEHDSAAWQLTLRRKHPDGEWKIYHLNVSSPLF